MTTLWGVARTAALSAALTAFWPPSVSAEQWGASDTPLRFQATPPAAQPRSSSAKVTDNSTPQTREHVLLREAPPARPQPKGTADSAATRR